MANIGKFDRRIRIQKNAGGLDTFGGQKESWVDIDPSNIWARRVLSEGGESLAADGVSSKTPAIWEIRYRAGIIPTMRLVHKGTTYEIESAEEIERNAVVRLVCHVLELKTGEA